MPSFNILPLHDAGVFFAAYIKAPDIALDEVPGEVNTYNKPYTSILEKEQRKSYPQ